MGLHEQKEWAAWKCMAAMAAGIGLLTWSVSDTDKINSMTGGKLQESEVISSRRNQFLFYIILGISLQAYSAYTMLFMNKI